MQQYERNIRKAVDDCRVGRDWMEKRLDKIRSDPRALDDDTRTYGIIEQLEAYYKANQTTSRETILCSPTGVFGQLDNSTRNTGLLFFECL
jgi:hypothetical protein